MGTVAIVDTWDLLAALIRRASRAAAGRKIGSDASSWQEIPDPVREAVIVDDDSEGVRRSARDQGTNFWMESENARKSSRLSVIM